MCMYGMKNTQVKHREGSSQLCNLWHINYNSKSSIYSLYNLFSF